MQVRSGRQLAAGQILVVVCLVVTTFLLEPMMAGIWLKSLSRATALEAA